MYFRNKYCVKPTTEDVVLIGGTFDREVISIDDSDNTYIRMQIVNPKDELNDSEVYRIEHLRGRYEFVKVGVHRELSIDEALVKVIEAYKEEKK